MPFSRKSLRLLPPETASHGGRSFENFISGGGGRSFLFSSQEVEVLEISSHGGRSFL